MAKGEPVPRGPEDGELGCGPELTDVAVQVSHYCFPVTSLRELRLPVPKAEKNIFTGRRNLTRYQIIKSKEGTRTSVGYGTYVTIL